MGIIHSVMEASWGRRHSAFARDVFSAKYAVSELKSSLRVEYPTSTLCGNDAWYLVRIRFRIVSSWAGIDMRNLCRSGIIKRKQDSESKVMSAGKAHGQDRDYQVLCRNILQAVGGMSSLKPCSGDGIDVKFAVGGTDVTFDVALEDASGRFVVAESRRRKDAVKQEALFAFARKVELLRKETGREVAGVFFAKRNYQLGAVKHATWSGIDEIVLDEGQTTSDFTLAYHRYDIEREKRVRDGTVHMSAMLPMKGSLAIEVIRKDASEKDSGKVG